MMVNLAALSASVWVQPAQVGQVYCRLSLPLSPCLAQLRGAPWTTAKPARSTTSAIEKALELSCWQSVQWHAKLKRGGDVTRYRISPQRQAPSSGVGNGLVMVGLR